MARSTKDWQSLRKSRTKTVKSILERNLFFLQFTGRMVHEFHGIQQIIAIPFRNNREFEHHLFISSSLFRPKGASHSNSPAQRAGCCPTRTFLKAQRAGRSKAWFALITRTAGPLGLKKHFFASIPARWAGLCERMAPWAVARKTGFIPFLCTVVRQFANHQRETNASNTTRSILTYSLILSSSITVLAAEPDSQDPAYHHDGELAGSLKSDQPLPLYDVDPAHLANRLFAAFYIRESNIPTKRKGRQSNGSKGATWSTSTPGQPAPTGRSPPPCTAFPLYWMNAWPNRLVFDLSTRCVAPFCCVISGAIRFFHRTSHARDGDQQTRQQRDDLCRKLAKVIRGLTLTAAEIKSLPDSYTLAVNSGRFATEHNFDPAVDYLPPRMLTHPEQWQEIDFYQSPIIHDNPPERFLTLHTRAYIGRSYFRIFYRFPGGRKALETYLPQVEAQGINWKKAAQQGFLALTQDTPQVPVGTEVVPGTVHDDAGRPTSPHANERGRDCTSTCVRQRQWDSAEPPTNTGVGMNIAEYTLKRRLLFERQKQGGLAREPDDQPLYRVIFMGDETPDWGDIGRTLTISQDCRRCHTGGGQIGAQTMFSLFNQGGFGVGAQMGISHALAAHAPSPRGSRAATWKTQHETYRRLLEYTEKRSDN